MIDACQHKESRFPEYDLEGADTADRIRAMQPIRTGTAFAAGKHFRLELNCQAFRELSGKYSLLTD